MDQASGGPRRSRHRARAGVYAAAILAAVAVAGCGSAYRRTSAGQGPAAVVARAILPGAWLRAAAPGRPKAKAPITWWVNPDQPLPGRSPWRPVLAVARRFAVADMSYEVEEAGPAVRAVIINTCTGALAAELFSHRAVVPPGTIANQVRQRVVAVWPLERLPNEARVLATVRSARRGGARGALELLLVPRRGGWRVAAITVV